MKKIKNKTDIVQIQPKNTSIKLWQFQYTSSNFWITIFCLLLIFIFCMTATICYTVYKVEQLRLNKIQQTK